jgi:hypothetical protein
MSISTLINRPCVILQRSQPGSVDSYGNLETVDVEAETVCALQKQATLASSEPAGEGEFSATGWNIFLLAGVDINTGDAVVVDGLTYELVGDPWPVRNERTGVISHLEAEARRTAGVGAAS